MTDSSQTRELTPTEQAGVQKLRERYPDVRAPLADMLDLAKRLGFVPPEPSGHG